MKRLLKAIVRKIIVNPVAQLIIMILGTVIIYIALAFYSIFMLLRYFYNPSIALRKIKRQFSFTLPVDHEEE